jgi:hypothetical protein
MGSIVPSFSRNSIFSSTNSSLRLATSPLQTTTVRLRTRLYEAARCALERRQTEANSLNDLLINSLEEKLKRLRRELVDAEVAEMKNDAQYHRESSILAQQFSFNDGDKIRFLETRRLHAGRRYPAPRLHKTCTPVQEASGPCSAAHKTRMEMAKNRITNPIENF